MELGYLYSASVVVNSWWHECVIIHFLERISSFLTTAKRVITELVVIVAITYETLDR